MKRHKDEADSPNKERITKKNNIQMVNYFPANLFLFMLSGKGVFSGLYYVCAYIIRTLVCPAINFKLSALISLR